PGRIVVGFCGDGGFMMTGQELATALGEGIGPIILLFNNAMYGTIRMHQERRFPGRIVGTALKNPDFAALIRAYGGFGASVARTEAFAPAFEEAVASGRPAVIELRMDPEMITTRTTLSALRRQAETSNAALHWMRDAEAVIAGVKRALKPGARFVAEMGGHGNIAAVIVALTAVLARRGIAAAPLNPFYFPTVEAHRGKLEQASFTVEE